MTLDSGQLTAGVNWSLSKAHTGLTTTKHEGRSSSTLNIASEQIFLVQYTIASGANQVVDLRSFTNLVGESVTATKLYGLYIKVTGTNAKIKLEEHSVDGLDLSPLLDGTSPSITVSANGHIDIGSDANPITIDATHKNIKLSNTGSASGTIFVAVYVGTS